MVLTLKLRSLEKGKEISYWYVKGRFKIRKLSLDFHKITHN